MVNGSHHINNDGYLLYILVTTVADKKLPIPFASNAKITTQTFIKAMNTFHGYHGAPTVWKYSCPPILLDSYHISHFATIHQSGVAIKKT